MILSPRMMIQKKMNNQKREKKKHNTETKSLKKTAATKKGRQKVIEITSTLASSDCLKSIQLKSPSKIASRNMDHPFLKTKTSTQQNTIPFASDSQLQALPAAPFQEFDKTPIEMDLPSVSSLSPEFPPLTQVSHSSPLQSEIRLLVKQPGKNNSATMKKRNNLCHLSPVQTTASCHPSLNRPITSTARSQAQPSLQSLQTSIPAHSIQDKKNDSCHLPAVQITTSCHPSLSYPITSTTRHQAQPLLQLQTSTPMHNVQEDNGNNCNNLSPVQSTTSCHPSLHHPISSTTRSQA